ncbi:uncharacterized protein FIBRA_03563 [Fibroporia radiculosa]|uniref:TauD/TfdA-like domain-containing protein n=1 Tax=Fibroporia radiculosa TaxID=599839 RepID=J4HW22_9APHY|nr:uncharacterized protein FIBRA_03563 [Fibroporia radiculosa]CCM01507.1 predicted protein [Fibroporia radiculosa]
MAPVATADNASSNGSALKGLAAAKVFNPFYSPSAGDENDKDYKYANYKPYFPDLKWEPLGEQAVTDRGLFADSDKKALFSAAAKVQHLTPAIGTEITGLDLRQLSNTQKDELALLVAERGVVFFRDQEISIHEQLELARHFGPLHKHATTPVPREPGLEEVHVVYNDSSRRPDSTTFSKLELWHSDVSYEIQPPSTTSLKVITGPPYGGDTLWSSGYALYSSFSPGFQKYLEGLSAVHSAVAQADGSRAAGFTVRREPIETVHPVVRVHPATGWKSVYVNPGFTRRIVGLPKAESDAVLDLLFRQISENPDFQGASSPFLRRHPPALSPPLPPPPPPPPPAERPASPRAPGADSLTQVVTHSATFDFWPHTRHALRATPHGERPTSVAAYEQGGKAAKDRQVEIWAREGLEVQQGASGVGKVRGYND